MLVFPHCLCTNNNKFDGRRRFVKVKLVIVLLLSVFVVVDLVENSALYSVVNCGQLCVYIPGVYVVCSVVFNDVFSLAATGAPVNGFTPTDAEAAA